MIYIYGKHTQTHNEIGCGFYDDWKTAIERIHQLYKNDKDSKMLGEYYYFAKER